MNNENTLYYGDNLDILKRYVKDETVDLVYLDPPFNSSQCYNAIFTEHTGERSVAQLDAFKDTWCWNGVATKAFEGLVLSNNSKISQMMQAFRTFLGESSMMSYLAMMAPRLIELHRVLKDTGSIYLHCDSTASHYLKLLMDAIFGVENFRNEISWRRSAERNNTRNPKQYPRNVDILLLYSKGSNWCYNQLYTPYTPQQLADFYHKDENGRVFGHGMLGAISETRVKQLESNGLIWTSPSGKRYRKYYLDEAKGNLVGSIWADVSGLGIQTTKQRVGYPTQKPLALLERIIKASSKEGDVVLDPFCGGGTTIVAAEKLNRIWIGIDITHLAIATTKRRLDNKSEYTVTGEPTDLAGAEELAVEDRYQFQWWALDLVGARPAEQKEGADKGIDGRLYFYDDPASKRGKVQQIIFSVKSGHTGSGDIQTLRGVIEREKAEMGVLICMQEPTQPMITEAASAGFYKAIWSTVPKLQIITVKDLLEGKDIVRPGIEFRNVTFEK